MEDKNSALIPYILYVLSRKPNMCDTLENVCKEVREELVKENRNREYNDLTRSVKGALEVGQDLGIIYQTKEVVRLPFQFQAKGKKPAPESRKVNAYEDDEDDGDNDSEVSYCSCGHCKESKDISPPKTRRRESGVQDRARKRRASKRRRSRSRKGRRQSRRRR